MKKEKSFSKQNKQIANDFPQCDAAKRRVYSCSLVDEKQIIYFVCDVIVDQLKDDEVPQSKFTVTPIIRGTEIDSIIFFGSYDICELSGTLFYGAIVDLRQKLIEVVCRFLSELDVRRIDIVLPPISFEDEEQSYDFYIVRNGFSVLYEVTEISCGRVFKDLCSDKKGSEKIKTIKDFFRFINNMQGSDPDCSKTFIYVGLLFILLATFVGSDLLRFPAKINFDKIFAIFCYMPIGLTFFTGYWYIKKKKNAIAGVVFKASLFVLLFIISPFIITLVIMYKNRWTCLADNLPRMYGITSITSLPVSFFVIVVISIVDVTGFAGSLNTYNFAAVLMVFGTYFISKAAAIRSINLDCRKSYKRNKIVSEYQREIEIEEYKKAHYTMFILLIAVLTIFFKVIDIGGVIAKFIEPLMACFTIFIAFDRAKKTLMTL